MKTQLEILNDIRQIIADPKRVNFRLLEIEQYIDDQLELIPEIKQVCSNCEFGDPGDYDDDPGCKFGVGNKYGEPIYHIAGCGNWKKESK